MRLRLRLRSFRRLALHFRSGLHLHAALEDGAVFDADALDDDIAGHRAVAADVEAVAADHVALYLAHDDDFARVNVSSHHAVAADGDAVLRNVDGAFHAAVDEQGLGAADLALDDQGAANGGLLERSVRGLDRGVARRRAE